MHYTVWTAGHSNTGIDVLLDKLKSADIELLVDVRMFPMSRRWPQFNRERLAGSLAAEGIDYRHAPELGGRRKPSPESMNTGLRDAGFRGYADYMQTDEFEAAIERLLDEASARRTAIMCAEALPWRCHRSLISDALVARGVEVRHLLGGQERQHTLTAAARIEDGRVTYPALL
jgi:uncharacterized protein (DUF488 family)